MFGGFVVVDEFFRGGVSKVDEDDDLDEDERGSSGEEEVRSDEGEERMRDEEGG